MKCLPTKILSAPAIDSLSTTPRMVVVDLSKGHSRADTLGYGLSGALAALTTVHRRAADMPTVNKLTM